MHDGRMMVEYTISPHLDSFQRKCFAVLREHDEAFSASARLKEAVPNAEVLVLDDVTRGQAETVQRMLVAFETSEPFLVKDCDSYFTPQTAYENHHNSVSACHVRDAGGAPIHNKSFVRRGDDGRIHEIVEKRVVSEWFSCGGYYFSSPRSYLWAFSELNVDGGECFISDVIGKMLAADIPWYVTECTHFADLGTEQEWRRFESSFGVYLVGLEGVLFHSGQNGERLPVSAWTPMPQALRRLADLIDQGQYIVLLSHRSEAEREDLVAVLQREGVTYHQLIMGLYFGRQTLIQGFGDAQPYPAAVAVNTRKDRADFADVVEAKPRQR